MEILYPDFLKNPQTYDETEAHWQKEFAHLLSAIAIQETWESPWIKNCFANGTPCRDGNPIFSAVCKTRRMGIRVIQGDPAEGHEGVAYWTSVFAEGDPEEIKELVLSCTLSSQTLAESVELMRQWIVAGEISAPKEGEYRASH